MRIHFSFVFCCILSVYALSRAAENSVPKPVGACNQPLSYYRSNHYKIAHIFIRTPFDYLHNVRDEMLDALSNASIHENDDFNTDIVTEGHGKIRDRLRAIGNSLNLPITVNVVVSQINNCNDQVTPPTLDVVYLAFVSWFPLQMNRTFETRNVESSDPAQAAGVTARKFHFVPQVGYNRTSRLFGGLRTSIPTPLGALNLDGIASTSAFSFTGANSGQHTWEKGWIQRAEWQSGFLYSDFPTQNERLKQAKLTTQFTANSVPLGSTNAVLRFGGSLSGGHEQAPLLGPALPPNSPANNSIGELKAYAGISLRTGRQSFKASYGLDLGQSQTGARIDFAKHLADVAYDLRFLPADHRSLELESRFTAGVIQDLGAIPAVERFFGGNYDQNFLLGDSWQIRAAPFIRSIPQNRLNRLSPTAPIGGDSFLSANFTLAFTTFHRPLVPNEIRTNPDFRPLLTTELNNAESTLNVYWKSKDPAIPETLKFAPDAIQIARDLRQRFNDIRNSVPANLSDRFSDCDFDTNLAGGPGGVADILDPKNNQKMFDRFTAISGLVAPDEDGSFDNLHACVTDFRSILGDSFASPMLQRLTSVQNNIRVALSKINTAAAQAKSARDMAFVKRTVHTLIDEMNFFSVSPVAIFDLARIGPQPSDAGGGVRYGIGGGIRFTLLDAVRFTGGYAFNPNPKPWESRGAAFFSMDVISLFR